MKRRGREDWQEEEKVLCEKDREEEKVLGKKERKRMWRRRFWERERGKRRVESGAEGFGKGREDKQRQMS